MWLSGFVISCPQKSFRKSIRGSACTQPAPSAPDTSALPVTAYVSSKTKSPCRRKQSRDRLSCQGQYAEQVGHCTAKRPEVRSRNIQPQEPQQPLDQQPARRPAGDWSAWSSRCCGRNCPGEPASAHHVSNDAHRASSDGERLASLRWWLSSLPAANYPSTKVLSVLNRGSYYNTV